MEAKALTFRLIDPFTALAAWPLAKILGLFRRAGLGNLPQTRDAMVNAGSIPIRNHYYDPQISFEKYDDETERDLPGIDLNEAGQRAFLERLVYAHELREMNIRTGGTSTDYFHFGGANDQFGPGDAEVLYQVVRALKPKRIIEIGSGWSTKLAYQACEKNRKDGVSSRHTCIEPYEDRGLRRMGIDLVRQRVEDMDLKLFNELGAGDILFIDSTHIIRPHGDVTREYLQILPRLKPGVVVHVHDIFTPRNYPRRWIVDELRFWNEQYILEAFLTGNDRFEILLANNWMHSKGGLSAVAPYVQAHHKPGSFYMRKRA